MKKIIALALVFITVNLFAETEVKYFCKEEKNNNGAKSFISPDTKVNDYLKKLGANWKIIDITADNFGLYVVFEKKTEITIAIGSANYEKVMKNINDFYNKGYKMKCMKFDQSITYLTFEK